jgi:type I site-specific restriction-modification system R (restriction) subunit
VSKGGAKKSMCRCVNCQQVFEDDVDGGFFVDQRNMAIYCKDCFDILSEIDDKKSEVYEYQSEYDDIKREYDEIKERLDNAQENIDYASKQLKDIEGDMDYRKDTNQYSVLL